MRITSAALCLILTAALPATSQADHPTTSASGQDVTRGESIDYAAAAKDVTDYLYAHARRPDEPTFRQRTDRPGPADLWTHGVIFPALLAAARHEPDYTETHINTYFRELDRYWDSKADPSGYEPFPTAGNGNDKYYDDNAWLVLTFVEAFEQTGDRRFLERAEQTLRFVLSAWDDAAGGGLWWHERHKDGTKNTCVNAPAAVGCLRLAKHLPAERAKPLVAEARRIVDWTVANLELDDGLFADRLYVATGKRNEDRLTYNTALMIRAYLGLADATGEARYRDKAIRAARAADWFADARTGVYRDAVKWSHLMVEADLAMHRATGDPRYLDRATTNAKAHYARWCQRKPAETIDHASIARMLWLVAEAIKTE